MKSFDFREWLRGKVIDEDALINALKNNTILAAGLDVFDVEPLPAESELCNLTNATLFPHIGSATHEAAGMVICAVDNLIAALNGDFSVNCANRNNMVMANWSRYAIAFR